MHVNLKPITAILKSNYLEVPPYQRSYAWTDNIPQLMEDIHDNLGREKYFIGTVCTSEQKENARIRVIDGQQRFATVSIMLAAARDQFASISVPNQSNILAHLDSLLHRMDMGSNTISPILKMSRQDNFFFEKRFISREGCAPKHDSHKRLEKAYEIVRNAVAKMTAEELQAWTDFVEKRLEIIHIESRDPAAAYALFETINDRGVQLTQADLIKTHLFKTAGDDNLDDIQDAWAHIVDKMEEAGSEALILLFFRHYWSSIHGLTRERNRALYRAIQDKVQNPSAATKFARDLVEDVQLYSEIVSPEKRFWKDYSTSGKAYDCVETLEAFRVDRYRPLLLSAMRKWGKKRQKDMDGLLLFLVAWLARPLITGELSSGTLEKAYCKHAMDIHQGDTKTFAQLRKKILDAGLTVSDHDFMEQLRIASISKDWLARYFLATLETAMRNKSHPELVVNRNPREVHLEHIMPRKADDSNWGMFTKEQRGDYLNRIGNLTLLSAPLNESIQNGPYNAKTGAYRESELFITKSIPKEYEEWNVANLRQRQEKLAAVAVRAWNVRGDGK